MESQLVIIWQKSFIVLEFLLDMENILQNPKSIKILENLNQKALSLKIPFLEIPVGNFTEPELKDLLEIYRLEREWKNAKSS